MPRIEIRDVPADIYATYERRAAAMSQSLEEYLLAELSRNASLLTPGELVARVEAWRAANPDGFLTDDRPISEIIEWDAERDVDRRQCEHAD